MAKASLYDNFGSKEELIRSYLVSRNEARRARMGEKLARFKTPRERLLGVFDVMGELAAERGFRGCAFMRANAEVRDSAGRKAVIDDSRAWTLELFTQLAKDAGAAQPKKLARQLVILYDGALVSAQIDRTRRRRRGRTGHRRGTRRRRAAGSPLAAGAWRPQGSGSMPRFAR